VQQTSISMHGELHLMYKLYKHISVESCDAQEVNTFDVFMRELHVNYCDIVNVTVQQLISSSRKQ